MFLVGAGPGDPDLLTLAAFRAIKSADVIFHDDLVSSEVLALANTGTNHVNVGKRGYRPSCKQTDINNRIVEAANAGLMVVRLKAGDPLIFGRAGEEIEACKVAGVPITIIPGVTSAQGAAASLCVSLTHRDHARRVQYITGHDRKGHLPEEMDWTAVADRRATTVVYMPVRTIGQLSAKLIALGMPLDTPTVAVANATRPGMQTVYATIETIGEAVFALPTGSPVLVFIGRVFALTEKSSD